MNPLSLPKMEQLVSSATHHILKSATVGQASAGLNILFTKPQPQLQRAKPTMKIDHKGIAKTSMTMKPTKKNTKQKNE